jgi:hypothetical protein
MQHNPATSCITSTHISSSSISFMHHRLLQVGYMPQFRQAHAEFPLHPFPSICTQQRQYVSTVLRTAATHTSNSSTPIDHILPITSQPVRAQFPLQNHHTCFITQPAVMACDSTCTVGAAVCLLKYTSNLFQHQLSFKLCAHHQQPSVQQ